MRHRVHRAYAGERKSPIVIHDAAGRALYFEGDELPIAPAEAVVVVRMQQNWDGGPPLRERVAILEEALVMAPERLAAVQAALAAVARALAAWDVGAVATCTWVTGEDRARALAGHRCDDRLGKLHDLVQEVAFEHKVGSRAGYGPIARAQEWDRMVRVGAVVPQELEDPYCAFGPSGPPVVPVAWRGRAVCDLENPYPALLELGSMGHWLGNLTGDEAVLPLLATHSS